MAALPLIRTRVQWCEAEGVCILCCPEAILGGLADSGDASQFAIERNSGKLESVLKPLASRSVTTIIGFTELADSGQLHNSAAVFRNGLVLGVYRKLHPAIRGSVYSAGTESPVFQVEDLSFGIAICNDSNHPELASSLAARGAKALFIPSNNGLPGKRDGASIVAESRKVDLSRAVENRLWVIRADVAGQTDELVSLGSSGIVAPDGKVVAWAREHSEDLIVATI